MSEKLYPPCISLYRFIINNLDHIALGLSAYIGRYQISIEQRVAVTVLVCRLVRSACTTVQNLISNHILSDICHPKVGDSKTHSLKCELETHSFQFSIQRIVKVVHTTILSSESFVWLVPEKVFENRYSCKLDWEKATDEPTINRRVGRQPKNQRSNRRSTDLDGIKNRFGDVLPVNLF